MRLKKVTLSLLVLLLIISSYALFSGGTGTSENPYLIANQSDLNNVRKYPQVYYLQTKDIFLVNKFEPIDVFFGSYDGDNYSIHNLNIKSNNDDNVGLFGNLVNGEIRHLHLINGSVIGNNKVGSLVGSNEGGTIYRCSASVNVEGEKEIGGLIGDNFGTIKESYSYSAKVTGKENTGGLIGMNNTSSITHSYSNNDVIGIVTTGGLVGLNINEATIECCYSTGNVIGNKSTGGLVGRTILATVINSYWDVESSCQATSAGSDETIYGKTTYEMLNYETFEDWAFTMGYGTPPIWANWSTAHHNPYILKTYPYLYWQGEPDPHNYPDIIDGDTHVKYFRKNRLIHWDSFPRLEFDDDWDYTEGLLENLLNEDTGIDKVHKSDQTMLYQYGAIPPVWYEQGGITFSPPVGYKLEFKDPETRRDWYLQVSGERFDGSIPLYAGQENWVGYWEYETQDLLDAIDHIKDRVAYIQGQDGGYYWSDSLQMWWGMSYDTPDFNNLYTFYGKMYIICLRDNEPDIQNFTWATTRSKQDDITRIFNRPESQYYTFTDRTHYEEFFIKDIENDEGLLEIGAFVGEECVGAALFTGKYPVRLMAYTDERHAERELSFKLHRGTRSDSQDHIKLVEVKNEQTGKYEQKVVQSLQQKYARIRLGVNDYTETTPVPQVMMGQNYPNPFVARLGGSSEVRTRSENVIVTNIPVYISRDMDVDISVYNIKGQKVRTLTAGTLTAGKHNISWNGRNEQNQPVSAGVYFYRLECDIETVNKKMLIVR